METVQPPTRSEFQSPAPPYSDAVAAYLHHSLANNTHRAYEADLAHFYAWGGTIPTTGEAVAEYLAAHAQTLSMATLDRRVVAISRAHAERGFESPTQAGLVRAVRRGIRRVEGETQRQAAPLPMDDLGRVLSAIGGDPKGVRDRAMLLLGFAGAFRRSELVALDREDLEFVRGGVVAYVRHSKTDQVYTGRKVGIPTGTGPLCPVEALTRWLALCRPHGPLFRRVDRHGNILNHRLSPEAVGLVVKERVAATGLDPVRYSGHSLRAGFATSAAQAGVSTWKIRKQTGHASEAMLARYIRDGELFGERHGIDLRWLRRCALELLCCLPRACDNSDAARTVWLVELRRQVELLGLAVRPTTSIARYFNDRRGADWQCLLLGADRAVVLGSTIHEAKGKEYEAVCVVIPPDRGAAGRAEQLIGHWENRTDDEAKRVIYVGITRAMRLGALAFAGIHRGRIVAMFQGMGIATEVHEL